MTSGKVGLKCSKFLALKIPRKWLISSEGKLIWQRQQFVVVHEHKLPLSTQKIMFNKWKIDIYEQHWRQVEKNSQNNSWIKLNFNKALCRERIKSKFRECVCFCAGVFFCGNQFKVNRRGDLMQWKQKHEYIRHLSKSTKMFAEWTSTVDMQYQYCVVVVFIVDVILSFTFRYGSLSSINFSSLRYIFYILSPE
jgi:hypothetical protein